MVEANIHKSEMAMVPTPAAAAAARIAMCAQVGRVLGWAESAVEQFDGSDTVHLAQAVSRLRNAADSLHGGPRDPAYGGLSNVGELAAQAGRIKQWAASTLMQLNVAGSGAGECELARRAAVAAWDLLHAGHGW